MKIERFHSESTSISHPIAADKVVRDEKKTLISEAVSFNSEKRRQQKEKHYNSRPDQENMPPVSEEDESEESLPLGKRIDIIA